MSPTLRICDCCHCRDKARQRARRAEMDDHMIRARLAAMHPRRPARVGAAFWLPVVFFFLIVGVVIPFLGYFAGRH